MRILKRLSAATMAIAMIVSLSTVASAAAPDALKYQQYTLYANKANITQGATSFTVEFGVKDTTGVDIDVTKFEGVDPENFLGISSFASVRISDEAYAAGIRATKVESDIASVYYESFYSEDPVVEEGGMFSACFAFDKSAVALNETTPLMKVTFTAPANLAVGTYKLFAADDTYMNVQITDDNSGATSGPIQWSDVEFVTVTAAGPQGPTVTEGATVNGITEYTFTNSEEFKDTKVLMTSTAATVTESTRFYASYNGGAQREFGSDIWAKIGQGGGSVSVANVKFGLIVGKGMDASLFTFEVCDQKL